MTAASAKDATVVDSTVEDNEPTSSPTESSESMPFEHIVGVISLRGLVKGAMKVLTDAEEARKMREQQHTQAAAMEEKKDDEGKGEEREKPHQIFEKNLEDVLKWQKENGRELLLNARIDDQISVADAVNEMASKGMSCVAIVDKNSQIKGVFTARDYLFRVVAANFGNSEHPNEKKTVIKDADEDSTEESKGSVKDEDFYFKEQPDATKLLVEEVMTGTVKTAKPYWSVAKAANAMLRRNFRHLAVIHPETRQVLGVVSLSDLLRVMLMDTESRRVGVHKLSDYFNINLLLGKSKSKSEGSSSGKTVQKEE